MAALTFLEAFNAKDMRLIDVSRSFVPSQHFHDLAGNWNCLLIGPRGSGKTTYLKMIDIRALRAWNHPEANDYRAAIRYTGIYVPSDIAWGAMVEALGNNRLKPECHKVVAEAAFCTNVLMAAVDAMEAKFRIGTNDASLEYGVRWLQGNDFETGIRAIALAWKLQIEAISFTSLRTALGQRLLDISAQAAEISAVAEHTLKDIYEKIPYASLRFDSALTFALDELDRRADDADAKWALLLDEFEIAPPQIHQLVVASLRSANRKLFYKIALAPCGPNVGDNITSSAPPSDGNDFREVYLWYGDKKGALAFCTQLFNARFSNHPALCGKTPAEGLGKSLYVESTDDQRPSTPTGKWAQRWEQEFIELHAKDESFRKFLAEKEIDPQNLDSSSSLVRKIAPIVAFRNAHLRSNDSMARKGRKKLFFAYTGWEAVAAITEGNPRWFIGVLNMIVSRIQSGGKLPVPQSTQHDQVCNASEHFCSMLRTAAHESALGLGTRQPVFSLLEKIGRYFNARIVNKDFIEEIPLSFEVDNKVDDDVENALRIAFNLGAIVCLSDSDGYGGFKSLRGKRFRLAYLLAPEFKLPLRSTKHVVLSSILSEPLNDSLRRGRLKRKDQKDIFLGAQGNLW